MEETVERTLTRGIIEFRRDECGQHSAIEKD